MNIFRKSITLIASIVTGFSLILLTSCNKKPPEGMIIITQVSGKLQDINYVNGNSWRYISQSRISSFDPADPEKSLKVLTADFYSARSPEVSCDGKHLLFAGQMKENDPWQIWEMDLGSLKTERITSTQNNCTDPAYLPLGEVVYSENLPDDSLKSGHSLYTGNLDGSNMKRITFNPHAYFASTVLMDGRILSVSRKVYPKNGKALLMAMRPDGTKCELFYRGPDGRIITSRAWETSGNNIVFIESDENNPGNDKIISVNYNNPFASKKDLTPDTEGSIHSLFPESSGKLLITYRKPGDERYALYEYDPETMKLGKQLLNSVDFDILEAVEVKVHPRPRKMPSEVHMDIKTGLIVCQDAKLLDPAVASRKPGLAETAQIEIIGIDSAMGDFSPEPDGSFYLRIKADKPFRIRSIDSKGNVIQSCDWLWLRPNERRGCVGCHENPELAPENRIPMAVKKSPIGIPIHVSKIKEIMIDTE
jgi:hypothetical protein